MFWNVASVRDEIALRKCPDSTAHLRTFRRSVTIHLQKTKNTSEPQNQFVVSIQIRQRMQVLHLMIYSNCQY